MDPLKLLAKSATSGREKTLVAHVEDDMTAFSALFGTPGTPSQLGRDWLRFFRIPTERHTAFWRNAAAAIVLHDLGKANDGFQGAVWGTGSQVIRHEQLSAFLVMTPGLDTWLTSQPDVDAELVLSAVLGHHLKAAGTEIGTQLGERMSLRFFSDAPEVRALLALLAQHLGAAEPSLEFPAIWSFNGSGQAIHDYAHKLTRRFERLAKQLRKDANDERSKLFRAVKAALIVADSAGSGLARQGHGIAGWIDDAFSCGEKLDVQYIEDNILAKRARQIEQRTSAPFAYHGFQEQAATMPPRTLMIAPCGVGKTLAAWRWIKAQLAQSPRGRVIFLYPTRATATEGFRDYVAHAPEADASLLTGTAAYELRDIFDNPDDSRRGSDYLSEARLYALGYWNKRLFSATVDQFLSFMQQSYKGICLLPVLADAVVVFDEVHSFDAGMFDAFVKFLHYFDLPVLAMTASLPVGRRRILQDEGLRLFTGTDLDDLIANAELQRYGVTRLVDNASTEAQVRTAVKNNDSVLWVVNTVDRAQALAQRLADLNPICYHSRYTLDDRKRRHNEVIQAFQGASHRARLAITTQVCEMSLDLDARMLVTEFAPIPALIQRMGRCNRHARPGDNVPGRVLLYRPETTSPYASDEMQVADRFVAELHGRLVSQADLEALLERFTQGHGREADRWTAFIDDGPWAYDRSDELRDSDDYSVRAVLDCDIEAFLQARRSGAPTDGYILPVPRGRLATPHAQLPRFVHCAPADHYDALLGFLTQPKPSGQGGQP
jgi:CRISPR-associated endonuclease/helicase Cas3